MAGISVLTGDIPAEGVIPVLQQVEQMRTTGVLRFERDGRKGEVAVVRGELVSEQTPLDDGTDPLELLLSLDGGRYEVLQRLPALPVSRGDEAQREGSLAVHVPADLMNYCERAGLTGLLQLEQEDRAAEIVYDRGELVGIQLDGTDADDLNEVFGWQEGRFRVEACAEAPHIDDAEEVDEEADVPTSEMPRVSAAQAAQVTEPEDDLDTRKTIRRRRDSTGRHFLRVVEMELGRITTERENRRPASRSSPPLPPMGETRRPDTMPPAPADKPKRPRNPTVKVVYLGAREPEPGQTGRTKHVYREVGAETGLPDAAPDRREERAREPSEQKRMTAKDKSDGGVSKPADGEREAASKRSGSPATPARAASAGAGGSPEAPPAQGARSGRGWDLRGLGTTVAWTVVLVALGLIALALLARLPPLE